MGVNKCFRLAFKLKKMKPSKSEILVNSYSITKTFRLQYKKKENLAEVMPRSSKTAKNGQSEPLKTDFFEPLKKSFKVML